MLDFLHPHIKSQVVDNSSVFETAVGGGTALFQPYLSDKGEDGKIELITQLEDMLMDKGTPNYKKHGQSMYNMINWLKGSGRVYGLRLTADDATYSNTILNVKTKVADIPVYEKDAEGEYILQDGNKVPEVDGDGEPVTQPGVKIKLVAQKVSNLTSVSDLLATIEQGMSTLDQEGFKSHPIYVVRAKGRGEYGNNFIYRLALNTTLEDTYEFRLYNFSILEKTENGSLVLTEGPMPVSMFPEAISLGGTSLFMGQVVSDYFEKVEVLFSEKAYDALIDDITAVTGTDFAPQTIDFIFGRDKTNKAYETILFETDSLALDKYSGVSLEDGSDGAFGMDKPNRQTAITEKFVKAYTGLVDRDVFNKKKFPFDVVLDANYPLSVKTAIADFCAERIDVFGILDTGILPSPNSALSWRKNSFQADSLYLGIWGQSWKIFDTYTAQDIPVTTSFFLARKIPESDGVYGIQYPFVGPNRGIISGFKSIDWNPNEYEKEDLYKARINYAEQDYKNTKFMSQLTSQAKTSALSNVNNVRVLLRMIRTVNELSENYQFEFGSVSTLNSFNSDLSNYLSEWTSNGACTVCEGLAYQTAIDKQNKTARVRISVEFTDVIERILIEFNIGK